jgi:predicted outer membrane repeat protein
MKTNKLLIFSLVFIGFALFFSLNINAVDAASTNTYVNVATGNDAWNGNSAVHTTGITGPKKTIGNALSTVVNYGTINIAPGTYNEHGITIQKNVNINGQSQKTTIIDGQYANRIFTINNAIHVNIIDLQFINGKVDGNGGAIVNYNGYLSVSNSTFNNNKAYGDGGAIYSGHGSLNVNTNSYTGNSAYDGGALADNDGTGSVKYTLFTRNGASQSGGGGAIVNYYCTLTMTQNTFNSNYATNGGGGALKNGGGSVSSIRNNFNYNSGKGGGAILSNTNGYLATTNNTFKGNRAVNGGAGGAISNSRANANIENCNFISNLSIDDHAGAVMSYYGYVDITNCNFDYNSANLGGGTVHNEEYTMNILNSTFNYNSVTNGGGGAVEQSWWLKGALNMNYCTFSNNKAATDGGAVTNYQAVLGISNCVFKNNQASKSGGVIYNGHGTSNIQNDTFTSNTGGEGGAIAYYQPEKHSDYINNCTFTSNVANSNGGGAIIDYYGVLKVEYCKFYSNHAYNDGGASIKNGGGKLTVDYSNFSQDTSGRTWDNEYGIYNNNGGSCSLQGNTIT